MVVVEITFDFKCRKAAFAGDACHFPDAMNSQLFTIGIWRRKKHLNSDLGSDRRATCTTNESAIECQIACTAAIRMTCSVVPVENYRKFQFIAHCGATFGSTNGVR